MVSISELEIVVLVSTVVSLIESPMSTQEAKRQRIADLFLAGVEIRRIVETVGASISTVYNAEGRILDGKGIKRKQGSGSVNKKRDPVFLKSFKSQISKHLLESMRKLSRDMKFSPRTIRRAVHTGLQLGSYVRTPKHLLTYAMKARRLETTKNVLQIFGLPTSGLHPAQT